MTTVNTDTFIVIMNEKGEFFYKDSYTGGYPGFSKYVESAEKYTTIESLLKDKDYFDKFKEEFKNTKKAMVVTTTKTEIFVI